MIREQRKTYQWQNVSGIDLGPGQYSPYTGKDGRSFSIGQQEKPYKLDTCFPKKKINIPFGSEIDRFQRFNPSMFQPGPCSYDFKPKTVDDTHNSAATAFKSQSPRLQMYYELERNISKSMLTYDKQEKLAKQLVDLIDRKMKERAPSNLLEAGAVGSSFGTQKQVNTKILTGLAITNSANHEKIPSIPFEPRKEETLEKVGPGTYNPNLDVIHKKLPSLAIIQKKSSLRPVPKKALESFINTVFTTNERSGTDLHERDESKERSPSALKKNIKLGKALFVPRTEVGTPTKSHHIKVEEDIDPFNKPSSIFMSKTKRTNFIDEKALGPGVYNPHESDVIGSQRESQFRKKTDFGNQEGRKFTLNRNMKSPFNDSTYIENPDSWKYQHPEKESAFNSKKAKLALPFQISNGPMNLSTVQQQVVKKHGQTPGPGSYDVNFKDELKILDQKLSIRYQLGPFGSTSPRFKEKNGFQEAATNDQKSQQIFNIMKKQEQRKYMDEALSMIKNIQKNQESFIFKSSIERFRDSVNEPVSPSKLQISGINEVKDREQTIQSLGQSSTLIKPYQPQVLKPFDTTSPRFNYNKVESQLMKHPGPGHYAKHYEEVESIKKDEIKRSGTINKKYIPAIGNESKEKFSLFGQIVKNAQETLGPGSYDVHQHKVINGKKNFNASLTKQNSPRLINNTSGLGQSSLSTNIKLSPRSNNSSLIDMR